MRDAARRLVIPTRATVIVTVRNESANVEGLLRSLFGGTRAPDEVVIVDGGSADDTVERLRRWAGREPRLRVLEAAGNRSAGRNAAIRAAANEVIAGTDAGVVVDAAWLERILAPFAADPGVDVVTGFYRTEGATPFERAAAILSAPARSEVDPERFLPSTRSIAFRRSAWAKVGGFDEALLFAEDTKFGLALKAAGCRFAFAPDAVVVWRPRGDVRSFFRQFAHYGFGDGEARIQGWLYASIAAKYAAAAALAAAGFSFRPAWIVLAAGVLLFAAAQARRGLGRIGIAEALLGVPALKVVYDAGLLSGYVRGRLSPAAASPRPAGV